MNIFTTTIGPTTQVTVDCNDCGKPITFDVPSEEWVNYISYPNLLIQKVLPSVSPDYRELLISGTCPTCWDAMFLDEDGEEF